MWVACSAIPVLLHAQQTNFVLKGIVTDKSSGTPISGASVTFGVRNSLLRTDSNGVFSVVLAAGEQAIKITRTGYQTSSQLVNLDQNKEVTFELVAFDNQIEEVVITSRQNETNVATPSLGVSVLSLKAIRKLPVMAGEVDIIRSLQTLPGVSAVGEGSNGVNIRGGNVDQNLIYLDDMPIINPTHMFGLFSVFATDAIREFQMYKGSIPAKYGGRTASILDVKMVNPNTEKFKMNGGIGLVSNRLTMEIPLLKERLSLLTSARLSYNNYLVDLYNQRFRRSQTDKLIPDNNANFYDLANKLYFRPNDKNVLSVSTYFSNDNFEVDSLFGLQNIVAKRTYFRYGHENYAINWSHFFKPEFVWNTVAVYSNYSTRTEVRDSANQAEFANRLKYRQLKSELVYIVPDKHRVTAGLSGIRYDNRPGSLLPIGDASTITPVTVPDEQAWEFAAYAAEEYQINDRLMMELGLRYAHYRNIGPLSQPLYDSSQPRSVESIVDTLMIGEGKTESTYGGLEPRLALRYKLNDRSSIKIGYNRARQFIQLLSNNTTPLPSARWKTSNRYIHPQVSDFVSAGYFLDAANRFWEFSAEVYYRNSKRVLDFINSADLQLNPSVETQLLEGRGRSYGLEFMVTKKRGAMTGWANYTYARAFQQIKGDFPEKQQINNGAWFPSYIDKPHTLNVLLNFRGDEHNSFSFTFTYSTGRPFTAPVGVYLNRYNFVPIYLDRNNDRVAPYHRLDFSWTISNPSMKKRRWQPDWIITVYNVYARKNAYSYFFKPATSGVQPYRLSIFPNPILSLTYNFKFQ